MMAKVVPMLLVLLVAVFLYTVAQSSSLVLKDAVPLPEEHSSLGLPWLEVTVPLESPSFLP